MTVAAVDSDISDMVLVTKRNGLYSNDMLLREPRRSNDLSGSNRYGNNHKSSAKNGEPGNEIHFPAEDLTHSRPMTNRRNPFRNSSVDAPYTRCEKKP